ncbi:MAG TPA: lysophospholipid acyltransferase family protein [Bacteroidales bacterium]|nr:lysophospholipid acyltransferase family protein [Bacteroidales bacterium]
MRQGSVRGYVNMKDEFMFFLYHSILPYAGFMFVRILSSTYRLRIVDPHNESTCIEKDGSIIYASWHQRFFPGITFFASRRPIAILISQSRDGEFISHIVNILGWHAVRGSSSKGGSQGLQQLKKLSKRGYRIGHIVDGPQGPFGVVKPGLLRIAQVSGLAIVPTITSSDRHWTFGSWDRFLVPKPFSRVIIRFGEPFYIPPDLDEDEFEKRRLHIGQKMKELYEDTDLFWTDRVRGERIFQ